MVGISGQRLKLGNGWPRTRRGEAREALNSHPHLLLPKPRGIILRSGMTTTTTRRGRCRDKGEMSQRLSCDISSLGSENWSRKVKYLWALSLQVEKFWPEVKEWMSILIPGHPPLKYRGQGTLMKFAWANRSHGRAEVNNWSGVHFLCAAFIRYGETNLDLEYHVLFRSDKELQVVTLSIVPHHRIGTVFKRHYVELKGNLRAMSIMFSSSTQSSAQFGCWCRLNHLEVTILVWSNFAPRFNHPTKSKCNNCHVTQTQCRCTTYHVSSYCKILPSLFNCGQREGDRQKKKLAWWGTNIFVWDNARSVVHVDLKRTSPVLQEIQEFL